MTLSIEHLINCTFLLFLYVAENLSAPEVVNHIYSSQLVLWSRPH